MSIQTPNMYSKGSNAERHFDQVSEFYLVHPDLRERTPLTFSRELALVQLLAYCGLFREVGWSPEMFLLV